MASISSLGIGSQMDTAGMLEKLQSAEQMRLRPYSSMQNSYKSKISAWGQISSAMSSFQGSVKSLSNDAFNALSVSTNKAFTAKAESGAFADTHTVTIEQLAISHKLTSSSVAKSSDLLGDQNGGTRTITITTGNGKKTVVELKDDETSLEQIAKAINKQNGGANATVAHVANGYQLLLNAKETGHDGEMKVEVSGDTSLAAMLNTTHGGKSNSTSGSSTDGMTQVSAAQDAILDVDGIQYTRSTNSINDIISGITLDLKDKTETGKSEQLTLTQDNSAIKNSVKDFVQKYNSLLSLTSAASKYVKNDTSGLSNEDVASPNSQNGALMGDSTLRGMVGELRFAVNDMYGDENAKIRALADVGIKIDASNGQMTLTESKLDTAINDNPDSIAEMFKGHGNTKGLAATLDSIVTKYVGDTTAKKDGVIKAAKDGLDEQVKIMQTQLDKTQKLIDAQVERYRVQFQALDNTMSKMNSLSTQMSSMLASL